MNRKELLDKLTRLQPALASNALVPIMTHFWFDGETVMAYNDRIGISAPLKTGFKGAIPGATLLGLLSNSTAEEVMLTTNDSGEAVLKLKTANIKMAMLPYEDIKGAFKMPKASGESLNVKSPVLHYALTRCLRSTTDDTSTPDQLGVTFMPGDDGARLYSTNTATITRVFLKGVELEGHAIVPTAFCQQVLNLIDKEDENEFHLEITKEYALLEVDVYLSTTRSEKYKLFGHLIETGKPIPFQKHFERHFPDKVRKQLINVPKFMPLAIERAIVMAAAGQGEPRMQINVAENRFKLTTKAMIGNDSIGTIHDAINLAHPDVSASFNPKAVKLAMEFYNKMFVTDEALIMADDQNGVFLVSTSNK